MYADYMKFLGLTGGIASGKSTISRRLRELGAVTLDADELARIVVSPGWPALERIVQRFGDDVIAADGSLDRAALAKVVFTDPEQLQHLNDIVHPAIRDHVDGVIRDIRSGHEGGVLVYEIPLLAESEHDYTFDLIVVAEAPDDIRIERMTSLRGMSEQEARARLANQATNEERREIADVVIDTSGSIEHTIEQTDTLWNQLLGTSH